MAAKRRKRGQKAKSATDRKFFPSLAAVAEYYGVSTALVTQWRAQGLPDKGKRGYSRAAIDRWRTERAREKGRPLRKLGPHQTPESVGVPVLGADEDDTNGTAPRDIRRQLLKAQMEERRAKAELARLEVEIRKGAFMPRSEIEARDIARISAVKNGLQGLIRRLPPLVAGQDERTVQAILKKQFRDLVNRFAAM